MRLHISSSLSRPVFPFVRPIYPFLVLLSMVGFFLWATLSVAHAANTIVVNGSLPDNTLCVNPTYQCKTIQAGLDISTDGDTINVLAGTYKESVTISKSVTLNGANAAINPNTGTRVAETILYLPDGVSDPNDAVNGGSLIRVLTGTVTIAGFTIDGDNPTTAGAINGSIGVNNYPVDPTSTASSPYVNNITVQNNVIKNLGYSGVFLDLPAGTTSGNNFIQDNQFTNMTDLGIYIGDNFYPTIQRNVMTGVRRGVQTGNFYLAAPGISPTASIVSNTITSSRLGIWHNLTYQSASPFLIANNTLNASTPVTSTFNTGLRLTSIQNSVSVSVTNNTITGGAVGIQGWNNPTTNFVTINGGSITGAKYGVQLINYDETYAAGEDTTMVLNGVTISNSTAAGIYLNHDSRADTKRITLKTSQNTTTINGGATGVLVRGPLTNLISTKLKVVKS